MVAFVIAQGDCCFCFLCADEDDSDEDDDDSDDEEMKDDAPGG